MTFPLEVFVFDHHSPSDLEDQSDGYSSRILFDELTYIPFNFQGPAQLFHLRCIQFYRFRSQYHRSVSSLDEYCSKVLEVQFPCQTAIFGFSDDDAYTGNVVNENSDQGWQCNLLCSMFGASLSDVLFKANDTVYQSACQREIKPESAILAGDSNNNNTFVLLDKLDLAEIINYSTVQKHLQIQSKCNIDFDELDSETQQFEMLYPALLECADDISRLLHHVLSSLIQSSGHASMHFNEVKQPLLRHVYWVHSDFLKAFLQEKTPEMILHDENERLMFIQTAHRILLWYKQSDTFSALLINWYREYIIGQFVESVIEGGCTEIYCQISELVGMIL